METKKAVTVVCTGDLHCGSKAAICVPGLELAEGGTFQYSAAQRALYDAWTGLTNEWASPDILIINGDAIEGQARKESGVPCWSTDLDDQIECAARLIRMWKAKKIYVIEGTGYHVDSGGKSLEHWLGKEVGAERIGQEGRFAADELFLQIGEKPNAIIINAAHHIQVGTGWYRSTPLAREQVFAKLNASHKHKADIILRSHVHNYCSVSFTSQMGFTLPCWQLQTRYMRKKSSFGMVPDIGALRFRIYDKKEIRLDKQFFPICEGKPRLIKYEA